MLACNFPMSDCFSTHSNNFDTWNERDGVMKDKITLCGDNCIYCPRYNAKTEEELNKVAELWYRVGMRDRIVSADEMSGMYSK